MLYNIGHLVRYMTICLYINMSQKVSIVRLLEDGHYGTTKRCAKCMIWMIIICKLGNCHGY